MQLQDVRSVEWTDTVEAIEQCYALGWTDGLPVVPPTVERVEEFLHVAQRNPNDVLGTLPERRRQITVGKVAANAVMAGCLPAYMPVVIAATEAMLDERFNLIAPSSSQGGSAILVIVNGPIIQQLDLNCRHNLFGPGNRANATIGRAVRLILMNACAATPGLFDRTVIGHPGKYTYCIAENETETHWQPLHVERGFAREQSTVTVFAAWGPRQVRAGNDPTLVLDCAADVASTFGSSLSTSDSVGDTTVPVRQGQIAITIAGASDFWQDWTKRDVRAYLHRHIRRSVAALKQVKVIDGPVSPDDQEDYVRFVPTPDDVLVVYAGSPDATGYRCAVILSELPKVASEAVTKAIHIPDL
ncbi:hypothetical protein NKDENANG_02260 [Candidatus Entotheonellaceae bacterium PAL068K]